MKLHEIKGNLLEFPEGIQVVAHSVNTDQKMRSGIAKQISEQIPELVQADNDFIIPKGPQRLGHCSSMKFITSDGEIKYGFNLYGQQLGVNSKFGCPTDYDALMGALYSMRNKLTSEAQYSIFNISNKRVKIGFPKFMGSALGGGNFDIVLDIIKIVFQHYDVDIYIVDFN